MSQHKYLTNTRKKITYLAVAMALASTQLLAPGMASAISMDSTESDNPVQADTTTSNDGFTPAVQTTSSESDGSNHGNVSQQNDGQGGMHEMTGDDGFSSNVPKENDGWQGDTSNSQDWQDKHANKDHEGMVKKDGGPEVPKPEEQPKEERQPQPVEKVEKTQVVVKPAEIRNEVTNHNEVNNEVHQQTNVTVQQEQRQMQHQVTATPTPVVQRKTVVMAAAAQPATTTTTPTTPATPVISESKGALVETGAETKTSTLAGLAILGTLGALSLLTRRKHYFQQ